MQPIHHFAPSSFRSFAITLFVILLLALFPAHVAHAAVTRFAAQDGKTTGACDSWANACTLQFAITTAQTGDEIWVKAGDYIPTNRTSISDARSVTFQLKNGVAIYGGFAGTETDINERNLAAGHTSILSGAIGGSGNAYHVVTGSGVDGTAILDGFTIQDGDATGAAQPNGGGMFNNTGSPSVYNSTFHDNHAVDGGGIYNTAGSPTIHDSTFSGNMATNGGGMANVNGSSPDLIGLTFTGNSASALGGGMYNNSVSQLGLINSTLTGNLADSGGGMANVNSSPTLTNVTFSEDSATTSSSEMVSQAGGLPHLYDSILWGTVGVSGGSSLSIDHSIIQGSCPSASVCSNTLTGDPLLGHLGDYGGPTQTLPLLPGSIAIDAGNDGSCVLMDQRG
ncbi:MAG: choice-of-anchor Q domain-containing protein, partial [Anaerolineaceae bacterium]|nr:choice-of-anchor Q domain-containing protein [Anaerolineaceae bacterium]